jgi:hypothetical protein
MSSVPFQRGWKESIVDTIEDPDIGGGIEIDVAEQLRRAVEPVVVSIAFYCRLRSCVSTDPPLPPPVPKMPRRQDRFHMIRGTAPDKTADLVILMGDENGISVPFCHMAHLDWHHVSQPLEIAPGSESTADVGIFVATSTMRDLMALRSRRVEKNARSIPVDNMMPIGAGERQALGVISWHICDALAALSRLIFRDECRCQATRMEICPECTPPLCASDRRTCSLRVG